MGIWTIGGMRPLRGLQLYFRNKARISSPALAWVAVSGFLPNFSMRVFKTFSSGVMWANREEFRCPLIKMGNNIVRTANVEPIMVYAYG